MPRAVARPVSLRAEPKGDSEILAELQAGDSFEVLELAGTNAWGVAAGARLVGYIDAAALSASPQ